MTGEKKGKLKKKEKVEFLRNLKYKKVIYKILKYILIIALIYNVISLTNRSFFGQKHVSIFGINFFSIDTNSMKGDLAKYSLVITKKSKSQDFKIYYGSIMKCSNTKLFKTWYYFFVTLLLPT